MRVQNSSLGLFVPGLREFVPAHFTIPPQPAGIGDFVPASFSLPPQPAGIGYLVGTEAMYPIIPNSVLAAAGMAGLSSGDCGCGCNGHGACGGMSGVSADFSAMVTAVEAGNWSGAWTSFTTMLQEQVFGVMPLWVLVGGGLLAYTFFFSGGTHSKYQRGRRAYGAARGAYA
jgi:hypothetical protein